mgnify:FL=1
MDEVENVLATLANLKEKFSEIEEIQPKVNEADNLAEVLHQETSETIQEEQEFLKSYKTYISMKRKAACLEYDKAITDIKEKIQKQRCSKESFKVKKKHYKKKALFYAKREFTLNM